MSVIARVLLILCVAVVPGCSVVRGVGMGISAGGSVPWFKQAIGSTFVVNSIVYPANEPQVSMSFRYSAEPGEVFAWYREALPKYGWKLEGQSRWEASLDLSKGNTFSAKREVYLGTGPGRWRVGEEELILSLVTAEFGGKAGETMVVITIRPKVIWDEPGKALSWVLMAPGRASKNIEVLIVWVVATVPIGVWF